MARRYIVQFYDKKLRTWRTSRTEWMKGTDLSLERAEGLRDLLLRRGLRARIRAAVTPEQVKLKFIRTHLTGDLELPADAAHRKAFIDLLYRVAKAAKSCGEIWNINSGYRSYAEQTALYNAYLAGTGNLAARPGTSNHEGGRAVDVSGADGSAVGRSSKRANACAAQGLCFPVVGEPWHIEIRR